MIDIKTLNNCGDRASAPCVMDKSKEVSESALHVKCTHARMRPVDWGVPVAVAPISPAESNVVEVPEPQALASASPPEGGTAPPAIATASPSRMRAMMSAHACA